MAWKYKDLVYKEKKLAKTSARRTHVRTQLDSQLLIFVYLALPAVRFYLFLYRLASYNYMVECDQKVGIHVCSRMA